MQQDAIWAQSCTSNIPETDARSPGWYASQWCRRVLDDIVVYSKSVEEHSERLKDVFSHIRNAELKLKSKKCHFFKSSNKCLGHVVWTDSISSDDRKLVAVKDWPLPLHIKELHRFLGFTSYYRRFIKNYANVARRLTQLLHGSSPCKTKNKKKLFFRWFHGPGESSSTGWKTLHCYAILISRSQSNSEQMPGSLVLVWSCVRNLTMESSWLLSGSHSMKRREENYSAHKMAFLALHWAVTKQFHHYLYGAEHFEVMTDHKLWHTCILQQNVVQ